MKLGMLAALTAAATLAACGGGDDQLSDDEYSREVAKTASMYASRHAATGGADDWDTNMDFGTSQTDRGITVTSSVPRYEDGPDEDGASWVIVTLRIRNDGSRTLKGSRLSMDARTGEELAGSRYDGFWMGNIAPGGTESMQMEFPHTRGEEFKVNVYLAPFGGVATFSETF